MLEESNNSIDITAINAQIQNLKVQRTIAMDDLAIVTGQYESINKAYLDLKKLYIELLEKQANAETPQTPIVPDPTEEVISLGTEP